MLFFDPMYFVILAPALILAIVAQVWMRSAYAAAQKMPAPLSGAAAARHVLDRAGLQDVAVEQTPGHLSDHFDPRANVLRLSPEVYQSRTLSAVGIAAHEAGHALQHAEHYAPLTIRNAAVPIASFGSGAGGLAFVLGLIMQLPGLMLAGIVLFSLIVFFQLINLPVEFNASARAKQQLVALGIVPRDEMPYVNKVLNAAALTYVAATLESILVLAYYVLRYSGSQSNRD
ncbi:MAG: zinc metallopeptidase [Pirellulales bacterium]|nr:zinc metallopeptidase [Pirellulales bacterium]